MVNTVALLKHCYNIEQPGVCLNQWCKFNIIIPVIVIHLSNLHLYFFLKDCNSLALQTAAV